MKTLELSIPGCWVVEPDIYEDARGKFYEWYQDSTFISKTNSEFKLAQANCSISNRGVVRGIHFTSLEPGQSKFVTVFKGKVFDVLVDLRKNSPTFGKWESVILEADSPKSVYIPWGVGHGFMALEDDTVFAYLCDARYNPKNEFDLNAFDKTVNVDWPKGIEIIQSPKDRNAKTLEQLMGVLPSFSNLT